jgi:hypothetical protein
MNALRQAINESILESNDVAAAMAALKRTGKCPVFTVDICLEGAPETAVEPEREPRVAEELLFSELDVKVLAAMGISDPSGSCSAPQSISE